MPELTIKYRKARTLQALRDFAKYFDYVITTSKSNGTAEIINGVTLIKGDVAINDSPLSEIFSGKHLDAKTLRQSAWKI